MTDALTRTHDRVNAIGGTPANPTEAARNEVVDEVLAIIENELADQESAVELLHDLISLYHEHAAIGGGPGYRFRLQKAIERAEQFLGLDDQ